MKNPGRLLTSAVLIAATGSLCCIGPFLLLATGMAAAWMSALMVLEAYQPLLSAVAISMVLFASWQMLRQKPLISSSETVALNKSTWLQVVSSSLAIIVVLVLSTSEYWIVMLAS